MFYQKHPKVMLRFSTVEPVLDDLCLGQPPIMGNHSHRHGLFPARRDPQPNTTNDDINWSQESSPLITKHLTKYCPIIYKVFTYFIPATCYRSPPVLSCETILAVLKGWLPRQGLLYCTVLVMNLLNGCKDRMYWGYHCMRIARQWW